MDYVIKRVSLENLDRAFDLVWNTFMEFVAPDYSNEGIETFKVSFIDNCGFKDNFKNNKQIMYGAYSKEVLVGILSISSNNTISCAFVDKNYHRKGIGTKLFEHLILELKDRNVNKITLNASPYAVPFYHYIGFNDLDVQKDYKGILYTPMEYVIQ